MSRCQYQLKRGPRKGEPCGKCKLDKELFCKKHLPKTTGKEQTVTKCDVACQTENVQHDGCVTSLVPPYATVRKVRIYKLQPKVNFLLLGYEGGCAILQHKKLVITVKIPHGMKRPQADGEWYLRTEEKKGQAKWIRISK